MYCSCALGAGYGTTLIVSIFPGLAASQVVAPMGQHSQVVTATHDPILARNEAARPHRNVRQLERLDGGLCLVAPYVDVAAVEGGEDPWLCPGEMSAYLPSLLRQYPPLAAFACLSEGSGVLH